MVPICMWTFLEVVSWLLRPVSAAFVFSFSTIVCTAAVIFTQTNSQYMWAKSVVKVGDVFEFGLGLGLLA